MTSVTNAVQQRISTRRYLQSKPVPRKLVAEILTHAVRAPSGGNTQPWHVYVVCGDARKSLCEAAREALASGQTATAKEEFAVYPTSKSIPPAPPSFLNRRRSLGYAMYSLMNINKQDKAARLSAMMENYNFFGAPVGMIVTVDKACDKNGWGHVGCLLQTICLLAEERGLGTCLQEAWGNLGPVVYDNLQIPDNETVWCGIALGFPDPLEPVNSLRSSREPLYKTVSFRGFDNNDDAISNTNVLKSNL
jgi:nitroreductase